MSVYSIARALIGITTDTIHKEFAQRQVMAMKVYYDALELSLSVSVSGVMILATENIPFSQGVAV